MPLILMSKDPLELCRDAQNQWWEAGHSDHWLRYLLNAIHLIGAWQVSTHLACCLVFSFLPPFYPDFPLSLTVFAVQLSSWALTELSRDEARACSYSLLQRTLPPTHQLMLLGPALSLGPSPLCWIELTPADLLPPGAAYFGLNGQFVCLLS